MNNELTRTRFLPNGDKFRLSKGCFAEPVEVGDIVYIIQGSGQFHKLKSDEDYPSTYGRIVEIIRAQELTLSKIIFFYHSSFKQLFNMIFKRREIQRLWDAHWAKPKMWESPIKNIKEFQKKQAYLKETGPWFEVVWIDTINNWTR